MPRKAVVTATALIAILLALSNTKVASAGDKTISGEVISVEPSANTLVIRVQGKEMAFSIERKAGRLISYLFTGFLQEQDPIPGDMETAGRALADLAPGDKVTVSYTEADGKLYARSVTKS
ncbi:MAG: hypothetical protein C3F12_03755 [Candidatus Methylomirabilota bacterium]|nr:hypothetical protein [candidate division NC10 bacterium]PWB47110.1 MAG: hypothetical protein C3F12_03755 [candidate division NC10 bacterium]